MPLPASDGSGGSGEPPGPHTRAEFEAALDELLCVSHHNGVEVGFGVDLRHADREMPDLEVEITVLRKLSDR